MSDRGKQLLALLRRFAGRGRDVADLRRAEQLVQRIRWLVIGSWVLLIQGAAAHGDWTAIYGVYATALVYAAVCHWAVRRVDAIVPVSIATTIGDTLVVSAMTLVTGGIDSPIFAVFYLAVLATGIRFGMVEAFAVATLNVIHAGLIAAAIGAPPLLSFEIGQRAYVLYFVALIGGLLSREAREHHGRAKDSEARSRELLRRIIEADEIERRRIAGELHDRMGKRFFDLYYDLRQCRAIVGDRDPVADELFERLEQNARECAGEIRSLTNELRPSVLDDFGFIEALKEFVIAVEARGEISVTLAIDEATPAPSSGTGLALLRVLQEAVLNARKHASARHLRIQISPAEERGVRLLVGDDGVGFDPAAVKQGHYGILYMRERIEACGGRLTIRRGEGGGSVVDATVPMAT